MRADKALLQIIGGVFVLVGAVMLAASFGIFTPKPRVYTNEELAEYAVQRTVTLFVTDLKQQHYIGSGVYVSPNGHILTAAHLFKGGVINVVALDNNGQMCRPELLFVDFKRDLALLSTGEKHVYASVADPRYIVQGQAVMVAGAPLGMESSVCHGMISATNRDFPFAYDTVQMDAPVNPGNSGGPAFNQKGEVVGICSFFRFAFVPANSGLSFFVSAAQIRMFLAKFRGIK